jgi:hypothetical protein
VGARDPHVLSSPCSADLSCGKLWRSGMSDHSTRVLERVFGHYCSLDRKPGTAEDFLGEMNYM